MTSVELRPNPVTVLDLFAGCGGLTEGFHQYRPEGGAGPVFRTVGAVEWEPAAAASYAANFGGGSTRCGNFDPPEIVCRDIDGWEPKWIPGDVDVVVGGPPCQGFSGLNREKVRATRNTLWQEFIRVVVALQPKVFVIENVDRFLRSVEFKDLKERIGGADLTNYRLVDPGSKPGETEWEHDRRYLLNAANYGAAQARRRAIVIGVRTDVDLRVDLLRYPKPTHSKDVLRHKVALKGLDLPLGAETAWESVDGVFADSARMAIAADLPTSDRKPVQGVDGKFAGPFLTTDLHIGRRPETISVSRYQAIPTSGNRKNLRGRYACRFDDGAEIIIEKDGEPRGSEGELNVLGAHFVVDAGATTNRRIVVTSIAAFEWAAETRTRRSKSEKFRAVVSDGDVDRNAELEYLSTEAWDAHDAGAGDVMGRLRCGEPSVTIRTEFFKPEKGRYLHPTEHRPITHFEAARLQGFPDDFKWCGSKLDIAKQIGNAVPVPLGRKIAESIYEYLNQSPDGVTS
ncbi:DNA cytosine methyltransferase [Cellulomonas sp. URHB0016]